MLAVQSSIPAMSLKSLEQAQNIEGFLSDLPQIEVTTWHTLHAGVYTRTIFMAKNSVISGALIKISTNLIVSGHIAVSIGENKAKEYKGYHNLTAMANRKQVFVAMEDTYLTMYFATWAGSVEEAENEFTDEGDKLISRKPEGVNNITITGV